MWKKQNKKVEIIKQIKYKTTTTNSSKRLGMIAFHNGKKEKTKTITATKFHSPISAALMGSGD